MILILSESTDLATYEVVKWLESFGREVIIVTDDEIENIHIEGAIIKICINGNEIIVNELEAYWYRRGNFKLPVIVNSEMPEEIKKDIIREQNSLIELLHAALLKVPHLGSLFNADLNRVNVIWRAVASGLSVPNIGLFNRKNDVWAFINKHGKIILKPIRSGLSFIDNNKLYVNYTTLFTEDDITVLPLAFPASLFMEYIEKKYELRIFYLDEECFTMAIFSQEDPKTTIDFRKYNKVKPNRNASYMLPENIKVCIIDLMKTLSLKTGCIDMIVTPDDEFIFLEVNPVGQFLNIDKLCKYGLTHKIANYLDKIVV
jgi:ATP-GRASP peptide maturase of grasp-with-spasm system